MFVYNVNNKVAPRDSKKAYNNTFNALIQATASTLIGWTAKRSVVIKFTYKICFSLTPPCTRRREEINFQTKQTQPICNNKLNI